MAMQESGKRAAGTGTDPALSADEAEELAASFKPAWDVDSADDEKTISHHDTPTIIHDDPATMTATAITAATAAAAQGNNGSSGASAPAIVGSPVINVGAPATFLDTAATLPAAFMPEAPRTPAPSSEVLDPDTIIETQPVGVAASTLPSSASPFSSTAPMQRQHQPPVPPTASMPTAPSAAKAARPVSMRPASAARDPFAAPVRIQRPVPAVDDDFDVPKKSSKGWIYVLVGVLIAVGVGGVLKFYLTPDPPKAPATQAQTTAPPATTQDIPPPPPKDEVPPTAKADPPAAPPADTGAPKTTGAAPTRDPVTVRAPDPPRPPPVAVAPRGGGGGGGMRPVQPAPPPPPQPAQPKTPPKGPGGGIVRDSPF